MPKKVMAYHKEQGPVEMYSINAREAVTQHPDEWAMTAWSAKQTVQAPALLPPEEPNDSENLPVSRTVQVVERDGEEVLQIGSAHEEGKPPAARPGFASTERLSAGQRALEEGDTTEAVGAQLEKDRKAADERAAKAEEDTARRAEKQAEKRPTR